MSNAMKMVTYRSTFTVEVEVTVPEEAITRVLDNVGGWQEQFYRLDECGIAEMLTRCCGINGAQLHQLDGWADIKPTQQFGGRILSYEMNEWERIVV